MRQATLLIAAVLAASALPARADTDNATFGGHGAFVRQVTPGLAKTGPLLDTGFSDAGPAYDTVMVNGEMPGGVDLAVCVRSSGGCDKVLPSKMKVYPNGRFWARFALPAPVSEPFKVLVYDEGSAAAGRLVLYGAEAFMAAPGEAGKKDDAEVMAVPAAYTFPVVTRAEWNAAPPTQGYTAQTPVKFTLHHTAGKFTRTLEESKEEVLFDQDYHQNKNGWIDIGYHFIVDPMGNIFEGRPVTAQGAHVESYNAGNVGISVMGYYHEPVNDQPTAAEIAAVAKIGQYLKAKYGVKAASFYAHRELNATACPGDLLYPKKQEIKDLIYTPKEEQEGR